MKFVISDQRQFSVFPLLSYFLLSFPLLHFTFFPVFLFHVSVLPFYFFYLVFLSYFFPFLICSFIPSFPLSLFLLSLFFVRFLVFIFSLLFPSIVYSFFLQFPSFFYSFFPSFSPLHDMLCDPIYTM